MATACASPPEGRARWTLELLAGAMVKLTEHKSLSHETVRRRLAENGLKPWRKDMCAFRRSTANTSPTWRMGSTSMPRRPTAEGKWCASESPVQLIGEVRQWCDCSAFWRRNLRY